MKYEYHFQVRLHDIDAAGVMFFARFFSYAHDAYEEFMGNLGLNLKGLVESGVRLPLAHASADFLGALRHAENVTVVLQVERLGEASFTLGYEFHAGGEICAKLRTVHVFCEHLQGKPAVLPLGLRETLRPYFI